MITHSATPPTHGTTAPDTPRRATRWRRRLAALVLRQPGAGGETGRDRGQSLLDGLLFLLVICAMLLPTTAGYEFATAAAGSGIGLPFAVVMFLSPFAVMALLPLRLLQLTLDGLFGVRLRLGLLAPLALVGLAVFLVLDPLDRRAAPGEVAGSRAQVRVVADRS